MLCKRYAFIDNWNFKYFDTFNVFIQSKSLYDNFHYPNFLDEFPLKAF